MTFKFVYYCTNPQSLRENRSGDLLVLGDLRKHLIITTLIEQNHVVHLFLLLSLAPLLLSAQMPKNRRNKKCTSELHVNKHPRKKFSTNCNHTNNLPPSPSV